MNIKLFITFLILFSPLFSELLIKTGDDEFVLKKGVLFSVNSDSKKFVYESFSKNLINNHINVNLIDSIIIYDSKKLSKPIFEKTLVSGLVLSGVFSLLFQDTWLFSKPEVFMVGAGITLSASILGGMIGNFLKIDTIIKLKNLDCTNEKPCTEWILIN
tara:strand:+ start:309 stop:785 length:477 start_codon:yes stop_codon:yes gene_type:complete